MKNLVYKRSPLLYAAWRMVQRDVLRFIAEGAVRVAHSQEGGEEFPRHLVGTVRFSLN